MIFFSKASSIREGGEKSLKRITLNFWNNRTSIDIYPILNIISYCTIFFILKAPESNVVISIWRLLSPSGKNICIHNIKYVGYSACTVHINFYISSIRSYSYPRNISKCSFWATKSQKLVQTFQMCIVWGQLSIVKCTFFLIRLCTGYPISQGVILIYMYHY